VAHVEDRKALITMASTRKIVITTGQQFGRLTVIEETRKVVANRPQGKRAALCRCECGSELTVLLEHLVSGRTPSCGCKRKDWCSGELAQSPERLAGLRARFTVHGLAGHPLYMTWRNMVGRCCDPTHRNFKDYGARGITVCPEWRDAGVFITWIENHLGPRPDDGRRTSNGCSWYSLDRIDNDGSYEPGNVQWATRAQQVRNRRSGKR